MAAIPLTTPAFVRSTFLKGKGSDTSDDPFLSALIAGFSGTAQIGQPQGFESYCDRVFTRNTYTEYFDSDGTTLVLPVLAYPIVTADVWIDSNQVWGDETKLTSDEVIMDRRGLPFLFSRFVPFSAGRQHIKVTYLGGLYGIESEVPEALQLACAAQVAYTFQNRNRMGLISESVPGGSIQMFAPTSLLPSVKEMLSPFVRTLIT